MLIHLRRFHNLGRYREIVTVLARHGFGSALEMMQVGRRVPLPGSLLKQAPASHHTPPEHLRLALEELGPTFIKLGQVLSTRPDLLPPAYIAEMSKLRDSVPPSSWEEAREVLLEELGEEPEKVFTSIEPHPLGSASLAQVYAATLEVPDGNPAGREGSGDGSQGKAQTRLEQVVIKVQRPNIQATIAADLEILEDLAALAQHSPIGEVYNPVDVVNEFAYTLRNELDYVREGRNADRFRKNFEGEKYLYIPRVYWEHTTRRVLVMERIYGVKIDDLAGLEASGCDRKQVALHATRFVIKEMLEDGFFHADPHPGNFVVIPCNVIGAMDFGMVGHLSEANRLDLMRLYVAAVNMDIESLVEQLLRMGAVGGKVDRRALVRDVTRFLSHYQGTSLKEFRAREIVDEIVAIAFRHHLRMPGDLWLVAKTMSMLEGMALVLDPDFDIYAVSKPYAERLVKQMWLPSAWLPPILQGLDSWRYILGELPRVGSSMLRGLERGELPFVVKIDPMRETMDRLDRLITRLSFSILIAAFVIGIAFVMPVATGNSLLLALAILGFVAVIMLGVWLIYSVIRSGRS
jgi:ubiquinone biosynthesis protein